jgi:hypothetical protein
MLFQINTRLLLVSVTTSFPPAMAAVSGPLSPVGLHVGAAVVFVSWPTTTSMVPGLEDGTVL